MDKKEIRRQSKFVVQFITSLESAKTLFFHFHFFHWSNPFGHFFSPLKPLSFFSFPFHPSSFTQLKRQTKVPFSETWAESDRSFGLHILIDWEKEREKSEFLWEKQKWVVEIWREEGLNPLTHLGITQIPITKKRQRNNGLLGWFLCSWWLMLLCSLWLCMLITVPNITWVLKNVLPGFLEGFLLSLLEWILCLVLLLPREFSALHLLLNCSIFPVGFYGLSSVLF